MNGYRQSPFANLTPVVKNLLIINAIFFIAFSLFDHGDGRGPVTTLFGAFYVDSPSFKPWQLITYMFMHANFWHILFNMVGLFTIGPFIEYYIGAKKFVTLYFICGIGAIVIQLFVTAMQVYQYTGAFTIPNPYVDESYFQAAGANAQNLFNIYHAPTVGASGAVFGLMVAFALLFPNMELMVMFIPIPVKAKYFASGYIVIELISGFGQFAGDNVAHFAHLGGALVGFILIKAWGLKGPGTY